ncbi:hypothetical protein BD413DRAFT_92147 [Trametes elegans]|nr:hypothetical protein BD413DRAFT_92147 [Trametes elegans]
MSALPSLRTAALPKDARGRQGYCERPVRMTPTLSVAEASQSTYFLQESEASYYQCTYQLLSTTPSHRAETGMPQYSDAVDQPHVLAVTSRTITLQCCGIHTPALMLHQGSPVPISLVVYAPSHAVCDRRQRQCQDRQQAVPAWTSRAWTIASICIPWTWIALTDALLLRLS